MKKILLGLVILSTTISCNKPIKQNIHNSVDSSSAKSGTFFIDNKQSKINWTGYKIEKSLNLNHFGYIIFKEGSLTLNKNQLQYGKFIADMSTIKDLDEENLKINQKLTDHLKSKDFLDVRNYPTATFTIDSSQKIEGISDFNIKLFGTLRFKNITKNIAIKANIRTEKDTLFLYTEKFSINRQDFGITYKGINDILINNDFDLQVIIVAHIK